VIADSTRLIARKKSTEMQADLFASRASTLQNNELSQAIAGI
jgi:hypothetical protein